MTVARHDGRIQICCDSCPASFPETFPASDFKPMVEAARQAGWRIEKRMPKAEDTTGLFGRKPVIAGGVKEEPFAHICPVCRTRPSPQGGLL